ncbi:MAG: CDP-alcohol phosphatidyltransferase family protein [Bryobacterales bacterium]|nr:CDP-alcohol phosphatidyltransferase family protein [Bryobacterales bacterium]
MRHLPNLLCLLRIALAPICASMVAQRDFRQGLLWFLVAGFTDFLDGFLARRMSWHSRAGAYLDPLADKVLLSAGYIALGMAGVVPWWLVGLIFGRDAFILAGAAAIYVRTRRTRFPPSMAGKVSTTIQIIAGGVILAAAAGFFPRVLIPAAIAAAAAGTLFSGLDYARRGYSMITAGDS